MAKLALQGRRILVVEDEYIFADTMERDLRQAGAIVLGPVPTVDEAMALIDLNSDIDSAVLDINLGEQKVYPVLDRLLARGTYCVFATGNDLQNVPSAYRHVAHYEKPVATAFVLSRLVGPGTLQRPPIPEQKTLQTLRWQLQEQIVRAEDENLFLIAAKLHEVLDVVDAELNV
jgi:CheY-like chemotaxis protein